MHIKKKLFCKDTFNVAVVSDRVVIVVVLLYNIKSITFHVITCVSILGGENRFSWDTSEHQPG